MDSARGRASYGRLIARLSASARAPPVFSGCFAKLLVRAGDGPAVAAIFLLGALTVIGAFLVEFRLEPPFWVHLVLWPVVLLPGAVIVMRIAKAALIWAQWRHKAGG